jgi:hypothetical protein
MVNFSIPAGMAVGMILAAALPAAALDRHVVIVNNTSYTINEFYASSVGVNNWEEDILGKHVLKPGQSVNINVDDGTGYCKYDFKAVFDDGDEVVKNRVNVCEVGTFTFND